MHDSEPKKPYAIIPRKQALILIPICLALTLVLQWGLADATNPIWWDMFLMWPGLIMTGALIVRCWPLLLLGDD